MHHPPAGALPVKTSTKHRITLITFILFIGSPGIFIIPCLSEAQHPIVLVPGDGGSQAYCKPKLGGAAFLIWINLWYFLRPENLSDLFSIVFDPKTGEVRDTDACEVLFPGWGSTWSIENLDTYRHYATSYFENLVFALQKDAFFVPNKTLRGAPFDFRKAPNQNAEFMTKFKLLIEETYSNAGNRRVVLLGHSMGSLYSLAFLRTMTTAWKRTYIKSFLCVSGPLAGSVKALKLEVSGDNFGIHVRSPVSFRSVQRSLPSTAFLMPSPALWPPSEPIIITPTVNYSAHDYEKLFRDINAPLVYELMKITKPWVDGSLPPEGIDEVYCIHGIGLPTIYQVLYTKGFPDSYNDLIYGDGDGTVHTRSLELCRYWRGAKYIVYKNAEHLKIVGDSRFIDLILQLVNASLPK